MPKNLNYHSPVLLQEVCHYLEIKPGGLYIDATVGGAGHSREIIKRGGKVLGLDQDDDAVGVSSNIEGLKLIKTNFTHLKEVALREDWHPQGILFDLGVSSHQFDTPERGFSFRMSGPLDMRMDLSIPNTAATLVNQLPAQQLSSLFRDLGEVPVAKTIAEKIVATRPLETTDQLAQISGKWSRQVFQALRMAVNDELGSLQQALPQALEVLVPGGRLAVISFHSLEDRVVKQLFEEWGKNGLGQSITSKPVIPTDTEMDENSRSKSAKLRVFEKINI